MLSPVFVINVLNVLEGKYEACKEHHGNLSLIECIKSWRNLIPQLHCPILSDFVKTNMYFNSFDLDKSKNVFFFYPQVSCKCTVCLIKKPTCKIELRGKSQGLNRNTKLGVLNPSHVCFFNKYNSCHGSLYTVLLTTQIFLHVHLVIIYIQTLQT